MHRFALLSFVSALCLGALTACGGDGGEGDGGDDGAYVATICSTVGDLEARLEELASSIDEAGTVDELNDVLDQFAEALGDAADRIDDADPPADVREAHDEVVEAFKDAAEAMEEGDIEALQSFNPGGLAVPGSARERLAAAAADAPECAGLGIFGQ